MTMIGFPPAVEHRWSLANWQNAPVNRWSFQHLREVVPTARVSRGAGTARPLPEGSGFQENQVVWRLDGSSGTVAGVVSGIACFGRNLNARIRVRTRGRTDKT